MKRLFLIIAIITAAGCTIWAKDGKQPQQGEGRKIAMYGVAFYNLENLFDTINNNGKYDLEFSPRGARQWNSAKYNVKLANLARAITAMTNKFTPNGPAVLGVSEIENITVLQDLVKEVDRQLVAQNRQTWNLQIVHHDSPDHRGVDVACLYNPRMFRFIDVTNTLLTIEGKPGFRTRDQMCVTGLLGGDTLSVIVNHWPSRIGGQEQSSYLREAAAALSKHIADSLWTLRPNQGVIVMGDLNDDPQDVSCAEVLGGRKDMEGVEPHGFYNPFWEKLDKGIGTLAYKGTWNLFDQIIISGTLLKDNNPDGLQYSSCKVNSFDFLRSTEGSNIGAPLRTFSGGAFLAGYSDHFPTEVFLIKPRK